MSLKPYKIVALAKADSGGLNIVPLASLEIRDEDNDEYASIFADAEGLTEITQPTQVDQNGEREFWIEDAAVYTATVGGTNVSKFHVAGDTATQPVLTEELTADKTLAAGDLGKHFYTLPGTSADIEITVPAGLGDGFHASFFHQGSGTFNYAESGTTIEPPAGGTLIHPTGGYGSIVVFGSDDLIKLFGLTTSA